MVTGGSYGAEFKVIRIFYRQETPTELGKIVRDKIIFSGWTLPAPAP